MHDSQSPDDDPDLDGIDEAFDFGEDGQPDVVQTRKRRPLNKSVLLGFFFLVLGTIAGVGYRFLRDPVQPSLAQQHPITQPAASVQPQPIQPPPLPASTLTRPHTVTNPGTLASPDTLALDKAFAESDQQTAVIPETQKALFDAKPAQTPTPNTAFMAKIQDALKTLNQQIDSLSAKLNYLDSYTHDMSQHLSQLNQTIAKMDQRLSTANALIDQRLATLSHTTSTLSSDVGHVKNQVSQVRDTLKEEGLDRPPVLQMPQEQAHTAQTVDIQNPEYQVHAVIPGRAWLKSTKGTIITVAEGDSLGNYGKVLVIDAAHGLVLTSAGVTFR